MNITFARLRTMLLAIAVLALGMVVVASPASAHQGSIKVAGTECVAADGTYRVTYTLSWSNVPPQAFGTPIKTRRDADSSFDNGWTGHPGAYAWETRGQVSSAAGSTSWTQTLPGTTSPNGPWEYAWLDWKNGNAGARFHDTRAEGLKGSCAKPPQPDAKVEHKYDERKSCETGLENRKWDVVTPYVWDVQSGTWVKGEPYTDNDTGWKFVRGLTPAEREKLDCPKPEQPQPVVKHKDDERKSCETGVEKREWDVVTPYVWDATTYEWVKGEPYTDNDTGWKFDRDLTPAEKEKLDCPKPEQPQPVVEHKSDERLSCETGVEQREWDVVTPYVWDPATYEWVTGTPEEQNDTGYVFVRDLTPAEKAELECPLPEQPDDLVTTEDRERESCEIGGTETWTQTTTTTWSYDAAVAAWVPDAPVVTETEPVLTPYTVAELLELCPPDVEGEEETDDGDDKGDDKGEDKGPRDEQQPPDDIEVQGAQSSSPSVPSVVDAGSRGATADQVGDRDGLWVLAVGGGVLMIGLAGSRRRATARR